MVRVLLVYEDAKGLIQLKKSLAASGKVELLEALNPEQAFQAVKTENPELVIVDHQLSGMTGLQFVNDLVKVNPLVNTALVSQLNGEEFHEETEGLGILMPLPLEPGESESNALLGKMEKIVSLMQPSKQGGNQ